VLWVVADGLGTLGGPLIASFGFQYLQTYLGTSQILNTSLVFGAVIIFFVLPIPRGIVPTLRDGAKSLSALARAVSRQRMPDGGSSGGHECAVPLPQKREGMRSAFPEWRQSSWLFDRISAPRQQ